MAESGEPLSDRELDVLRCLTRGATNKDIAEDLTISENTVKVHLRNIYTKLDVSSRTEATTEAIQRGIIIIPGIVQTPTGVIEQTTDNVSMATPALATAAAADTTIQQVPTNGSAPLTGTRDRRLLLLVVGALLALIAVTVIVSQLVGTEQAAVLPDEPFEETPIENSHWLLSRPMPDARANMAVASVGLDLYQIGGETADGVDGVARAFNSLDRVWRPIAQKPTAVADTSAAELYGEIYVVGGRLADGTPTSTLEAYSPTQDAWRSAASLPHPISGGLVLSDNAFLYLLGGHDGESFLNTAFVYDPATDGWRPLPPIPEAKAGSSGAALSGQLFIVGGENEHGESDTCYRFDTADETWSRCPDMLSPRKDAGSAVLLNKLYVIGGSHQDEPITFSEMYDPVGETWQVINTPMLVDSADWESPGVGQIEARIFAFGGRDEGTYLDTTYVFAPLIYRTYIPAASAPEAD